MKSFLTALAVFLGFSAAAFAAPPAPPPPPGSHLGIGAGDMHSSNGTGPSPNIALPHAPPPPPAAHEPGLADDDKDLGKSPAWGDDHNAPPPDEMSDNDDEGDDDGMAPPPPPPHGKGDAPPPPHGDMDGPENKPGPDGKFDPKKLYPPDSPENPEDE